MGLIEIGGRGPLRSLAAALFVSRVYQSFKTAEFVIISAFVAGKAEKENLERQCELIDDIKELGFGYFPILRKCGEVLERSILIPGLSWEKAQMLARKYNQGSFVRGGKGMWGLFDAVSGDLLESGEDFEVVGPDEGLWSYSENRGFRFVLAGQHSYLKKGIRISPEGKVFLPNTRLPRALKDALRNLKVSFAREGLRIPDVYKNEWDFTEDILESVYVPSGRTMEKFAYNPKTGEFLPSIPGDNHAPAIRNRGTSPFGDYVRAIIFHEGKLAAFRPLYPTYLRRAYKNQEISAAEVVIKQFELQYATMQAVKEAGATGWGFQYNANDEMLREIRGEYARVR